MTNEVPFSRLMRTAAALFATAGGVLALAGLTAWIGGRWHWLAFGEEHVPMAPSTALLLLLLCIAALLRASVKNRPAAGVAELLCTLTALAGGALLLLQRGFGFAFPLESWLAPIPEMVGAIPVGRMSPLTAGCFVTVALALLCGRVTTPRWQPVRSLGGWLALAVLGVAFIIVAAYAVGTPLLYGGATIPMALLTGLAFVFLAGALLLDSGPDVWPLSMFLQKRAAGHVVEWSLLVLFLVLTVGIGLVGLHYLRERQAAAREAAHHELGAIADLKVQQIVQWRKERVTDANLIRATPYAARRALDALAQPDSARTRSMFTGFLDPLLGNDSYEQLILLDTELNVRLMHPADASRTLAEPARRAAEEALRTREVVIADLHRAADSDDIHMDYVIPLVVRREGTNDNVPAAGLPALPTDRSAGVLMLQVDAQGFLFPLIQRWPRPSRSAETLLVRREGDEVVFLNELRHRKGTALVLRRALSEARLPAAMGLRGEQAEVEGIDYRGVPVVAATRAVPDTPWVMVAKVDQAELYAPLRDEALGVVALVLVLVLAAVLGVTVLWRRRNEHFLRAQLAAEHARRLLAERFEHLMKNASDAILLADEQNRILEANDRALALYGYSLAELQALPLVQLRVPELREDFSRRSEEMNVTGQEYFETRHLRKDGTTFPVEISSRLVEIGGQRYKLGIIRDISQRKAHEAEIERLNRLYATLSQVNQTIVRCQTRDELLAEICRVVVEFGRFKAAWIGWQTAAGQPLIEVARCVSDTDVALVLPGWRSGCGVMAETIHTGQASLCTDAATDPRAACCREALARLGVQSCAAFPLHLRGEVCGAFSICSMDPGFFSGEEVRLLEEVAADISFALDRLDKEAQRQAIADALRQSEAFTRVVLDNLPVGVAVNGLVPTVAFRYMNDNFPKFYRTTREALAAPDAFWEAVYEDAVFRERMRKRVLADCASGDLEKMHWTNVPITRRGQATTYITARNVPLPDKQLIISLVWDVTERKRAEQERALLTHAIAASVNEIYFFDAETWRFRFVSEGAQKNLGYTLAQLQQMTPLDLKPGFDRAAFERITGPLLRREESLLCFETTHRRADGSLYPVEVRLQVFEHEDDRVFLAMIVDITERKQAEETQANQLRELQRWHDATLGREGRILELKRQVNELLVKAGQPVRYSNAQNVAAPGKP